MTVIELPIPRAIDIPVMDGQAHRLARTLVMQYWRRSQLLQRPASRPEAFAVFDDSIVQALSGLKQHLIHAPELDQACQQAIETAGAEILDEPSRIFALACLQALHLQRKQVHDGLEQTLGAHLEAQPNAVFNAIRFCFDSTVAEYFTWLVTQGRHEKSAALIQLIQRLAISRPAVSDGFAQAAAAWTSGLPGGVAALCDWRCTGRGDEAKAIAATQQGNDAQAALLALALMGSRQETPVARTLLARMPHSTVALALLAARDGPGLAIALREGRHPQMPWGLQVYAASLVGDIPLLRQLAAHTAWEDEEACRTVADATALLTGEPADIAFDMGSEASGRAACVDAALAALPVSGPALRLGRPRTQVVLQESSALVGAPLRRLLYLEHLSRVGAALWIEADDLAIVQALACSTASVIERAAFNISRPQP
ncbi:MAG: hypothetical protein LBV56_25850 [Delftia acidovorans]|nr:hypothetical protein [Delftia acidovorans]